MEHDLAPGTPVYWQPTPDGQRSVESEATYSMPPNQFYLVNASNGQTIMYGDLDLFMSALPDTHAHIAMNVKPKSVPSTSAF